jgi:endonuclease YncB( thermonuclease family)
MLDLWRKLRRHRRRCFLLVGVALLGGKIFLDPGLPAPATWQPILLAVIDGDTVEISGYAGHCRLLGIDTPEVWLRDETGAWLENPHPAWNAYAASDWLRTFIHQPVRVIPHARDAYDRWLIELFLPGDINAAHYIAAQKWQKKDRQK